MQMSGVIAKRQEDTDHVKITNQVHKSSNQAIKHKTRQIVMEFPETIPRQTFEWINEWIYHTSYFDHVFPNTN